MLRPCFSCRSIRHLRQKISIRSRRLSQLTLFSLFSFPCPRPKKCNFGLYRSFPSLPTKQTSQKKCKESQRGRRTDWEIFLAATSVYVRGQKVRNHELAVRILCFRVSLPWPFVFTRSVFFFFGGRPFLLPGRSFAMHILTSWTRISQCHSSLCVGNRLPFLFGMNQSRNCLHSAFGLIFSHTSVLACPSLLVHFS